MLRISSRLASRSLRGYGARRVSTFQFPIKDKDLLKQQAYIGGMWMDADNNQTIEVRNPATGVLLGHTPSMGQNETQMAIVAADKAFHTWKQTSPAVRAGVLRKWFDLMMQHKNDLGTILTLEQGKPLVEALGEIQYAAGFFEMFSEECMRIHGDVIPSPTPGSRVIVVRQPVGPVGAITPWNFPAAMITRKVGAALAAGCTIVLKPSELTPFSALAMCELAERAGVPAGVVNVVTGHPQGIGNALTSSPLIRKITFTGSTRVGKLLMAQSADTVKRVSMELGGNAPFIIFDDADIEKAVVGCIASKFRNAGQTCVSANRIFVQAKIYDQFVEKLTQRVKNLKVGNGLDPMTQVGPLINGGAVQKVERHIEDAVNLGAKITCGGARVENMPTHLFYQPTVLAYCNENMLAFHEETFGPVAPIFKFFDEEDITQLANSVSAGLAAYFYSKDVSRCWRIAESLDYGMVGVNQPIVSSPWAPFGGVKQSGVGREGSYLGVHDYLDVKTIHFGI